MFLQGKTMETYLSSCMPAPLLSLDLLKQNKKRVGEHRQGQGNIVFGCGSLFLQNEKKETNLSSRVCTPELPSLLLLDLLLLLLLLLFDFLKQDI